MPQRLGQHFLSSGPILERIALAVCPTPAELVIEIGPGRGALTEKLLQHTERLIVIEIDPSLVESLRARFAGHPRLEVIHANVLDAVGAAAVLCAFALIPPTLGGRRKPLPPAASCLARRWSP